MGAVGLMAICVNGANYISSGCHKETYSDILPVGAGKHGFPEMMGKMPPRSRSVCINDLIGKKEGASGISLPEGQSKPNSKVLQRHATTMSMNMPRHLMKNSNIK